MANIKPLLVCELDPSRPVPEILAVTQSMIAANPEHEEAILRGLSTAVTKRLNDMQKGADTRGQSVQHPKRAEQDQGSV